MRTPHRLLALGLVPIQAASTGTAQEQHPDEVPMTTRERAYTSPIWYTP